MDNVRFKLLLGNHIIDNIGIEILKKDFDTLTFSQRHIFLRFLLFKSAYIAYLKHTIDDANLIKVQNKVKTASHDFYNILSDAIENAFAWSQTDEGVSFWSNLGRQLREIDYNIAILRKHPNKYKYIKKLFQSKRILK